MPDPTAHTDPIQTQYDQWPYPSSNGEDKHLPTLPRLDRLYWPRGKATHPQTILVAGCGSVQAASVAGTYPNAKVWGIDISQIAVDNTLTLKAQHELDNLEVKQLPIEAVAQLSQTFDLIIATGVIHHLESPAMGLKALQQVLAPEGVMHLMVYGKPARHGQIMLQDLFRTLGVRADEAGVKFVRETLLTLPKDHPAQPFIRLFRHDLEDAGLVDAFLNARNTFYSVEDCLQLTSNSGLDFRGWVYNAFYYPDAWCHQGEAIYQKIKALEERQIWSVMEQFYGVVYKHGFVVGHPAVDPSAYQINFERDDFAQWVPLKNRHLSAMFDPLGALFPQHAFPTMPYDTRNLMHEEMYRLIDGNRSMEEIANLLNWQGTHEAKLQLVRQFTQHLWRKSHLFIQLP